MAGGRSAARAVLASAIVAACSGGAGPPAWNRATSLAATSPYVVARTGELIFFWCRWETERPVSVAFPADARPREVALLERALAAWEAADLGVRFRRTVAPAAIEVEISDGPVASGAGPDAGNAVADCRVRGDPRRAATRVRAELERARIHLARRTSPDWRGRSRELTAAEFLGLALHELGHALGSSGHARSGETVMVREVDRVARAGAALLAGRGFRDVRLAALYSHPSGWITGRTRVDPTRTALVDELWDRSARRGLAGPFIRSGETRVRVFWQPAAPRLPSDSAGGGAPDGVTLLNWRETLRAPDRVRFAADRPS